MAALPCLAVAQEAAPPPAEETGAAGEPAAQVDAVTGAAAPDEVGPPAPEQPTAEIDAETYATPPGAHQILPKPSEIKLIDKPNDSGKALLMTFALLGTNTTRLGYEVLIDGKWRRNGLRATLLATTPTKADHPEFFGWHPADPETRVVEVDHYLIESKGQEIELHELEPDQDYNVRLVLNEGDMWGSYTAGRATTREQWFNLAGLNSLLISAVFAIVIMTFIFAARRNPNLFIRRIQGLEAVDEAIGRATEMGKPVLHINGLDPLSTLSTIAAVNILGRIARRVANYDSDLLVPCFDPVVMTVSQEVVRSAYLEAGRPDSYREDHIFFLTDQQFSYTASTCGIMVRERPAAIFLLGYFYAESLMLAETGYSVGAIQIAGTDAQSQLPFFITTCDYTLIGEELYAASAYLSREPMLLGSLKGQDVGKAFVMAIIIVGTVLATFHIDWLTQLFTPLI